MKKILFASLFFVYACSLCVYSNTALPNEYQTVKPKGKIQSMFQEEQYQEIVDMYAGNSRTLSATKLTYVAHAYFYLNDFDSALQYVDLAIQKDKKYSRAYYVKGIINNINGNQDEAITDLKKAIELSPQQSDYYTDLGDAYLAQENYEAALSAYREAVNLPTPSERAYYMIGVLYINQDDLQEALDAFYTAKSKIVKDKELYVTVLYSIAKTEYDIEYYKEASEAYAELTEYFPDDYYSYEKLVECYNILEDYDKANDSKQKLYKAYQKGELLTTSMSDKFCLGRFIVGAKYVLGYERYEEPTCRNFVKYIYYITDDAGNIDSTVFVEYDPAAEEGADGNYKPVMLKGDNRHTFNLQFNEKVPYTDLKYGIYDIVAGKIQPKLIAND